MPRLGSVALNAKPSRWENDVPQPTETLPDRIVSTAYLFRQSKVLFVAAELDVFGILAVGPLDLETLKARSGVHPRGARDFFDALVALGLLDRDSKGRYANTPESDCYLVRGKPIWRAVATSRQASLRELGPALPRLDNPSLRARSAPRIIRSSMPTRGRSRFFSKACRRAA